MTDLTNAYEQQLAILLPVWRARLTDLQASVRDQVAFGANVGALLHELHGQHRHDYYHFLRSLDPEIREHHIRIALKAWHFKQKHPDLDDISQLTFTLSNGESTPTDETQEPDHSRAGTQIAVFTNICMRLTAQINKLSQTPVQKWDQAVKRSVKEMLRPIAEIYGRL